MKKKENIIMTIGLLLLIVAVLGVSYAAFSYTRIGEKINTITTGVLSMSYTESDNIISIDKALPTTDDTGKVRLRDGEYFDFTIESTIQGANIINYEVAAEALSSNTFDGANVKLYLTKLNGTTEEEIMPPKLYMPRTTANTKTGRPSGMVSLTSGTLGTNETLKFRLRMYVKEGYNPQDDNGNEVFQVRVNVYGKATEEPAGTLIKGYSDSDFHAYDYSSKTTSIVTKNDSTIPATAIASWDISDEGNRTAVAYIEDDGTGSGTYKLTLGGDNGLLANIDMSSYFKDFSIAKTIDLTYLDTMIVMNMNSLFSNCMNLTSLNINNFDTSNVTDMSGMFNWCSSVVTLDLTTFDTSNVTDMSYMFNYCRGLTTLNISSFDTSKVMDMSSMFEVCTNLTTLNLNTFDTSNVTDMSSMFSNCSSLTTLDISNFDISSLEKACWMLRGCPAKSSAPSWTTEDKYQCPG